MSKTPPRLEDLSELELGYLLIDGKPPIRARRRARGIPWGRIVIVAAVGVAIATAYGLEHGPDVPSCSPGYELGSATLHGSLGACTDVWNNNRGPRCQPIRGVTPRPITFGLPSCHKPGQT